MMDDRAVSITLTYVLTIAITTVLVAGLVVASTDMLEAQRDRSAQSELNVVGERLASEITTLDRAVDDGRSTTITTTYPSRAAGAPYSVSLVRDHDRCGTETCVLLESHEADTTVLVPLHDRIDVESGVTVPGGAIDVVHDGERITLQRGER